MNMIYKGFGSSPILISEAKQELTDDIKAQVIAVAIGVGQIGNTESYERSFHIALQANQDAKRAYSKVKSFASEKEILELTKEVMNFSSGGFSGNKKILDKFGYNDEGIYAKASDLYSDPNPKRDEMDKIIAMIEKNPDSVDEKTKNALSKYVKKWSSSFWIVKRNEAQEWAASIFEFMCEEAGVDEIEGEYASEWFDENIS